MLIFSKSVPEFVKTIAALPTWPEWTRSGKMLQAVFSVPFEPSVKCSLRFKLRFRQKPCQRMLFFLNVWQLLMEALFFQTHAHSTYGHFKISSALRWRKWFGIRWKHGNVHRQRSLWSSFPSRSGNSNLKAFVCLFVQPIYFDYTVYSSEERKTCL